MTTPTKHIDAGHDEPGEVDARLTGADGLGHDWLRPDWPVAPRVQAFVTTRAGGTSGGVYGADVSGAEASAGGLNLGDHVGDDPLAVARNRLRLPVAPAWLSQVHGIAVVRAETIAAGCVPVADAAYTTQAGVACAVLTADCLPILVADRAGRVVGAAHAGWRGLHAGVSAQLVQAMRAAVPDAELVAWLGPCIGPRAFEVGPEVRDAFMTRWPQAGAAFTAGIGDRWLADLPRLARMALAELGIDEVGGGQWCTVEDPARFYSYRRDGVTGRFASVIWINP